MRTGSPGTWSAFSIPHSTQASGRRLAHGLLATVAAYIREAAMPTLTRPVTLALLACATSCATRTADVRSPDEASPRLISCGESIAPVDKTRQHTSVELRYTVSSEGRVEPGSLRLVPN